MQPTHQTRTAEQLHTMREDWRAEQAALAQEHGTYYTLTYASGASAGGGRYDHSPALGRLAREIDRLEYEIKCAQALAQSGFAAGDKVRVGPPYQPFTAAAGLGPAFGHDAITGLTGRVTGISSDGGDLYLTFDGHRGGDFDSAPISRCEKL